MIKAKGVHSNELDPVYFELAMQCFLSSVRLGKTEKETLTSAVEDTARAREARETLETHKDGLQRGWRGRCLVRRKVWKPMDGRVVSSLLSQTLCIAALTIWE